MLLGLGSVREVAIVIVLCHIDSVVENEKFQIARHTQDRVSLQ